MFGGEEEEAKKPAAEAGPTSTNAETPSTNAETPSTNAEAQPTATATTLEIDAPSSLAPSSIKRGVAPSFLSSRFSGIPDPQKKKKGWGTSAYMLMYRREDAHTAVPPSVSETGSASATAAVSPPPATADSAAHGKSEVVPETVWSLDSLNSLPVELQEEILAEVRRLCHALMLSF